LCIRDRVASGVGRWGDATAGAAPGTRSADADHATRDGDPGEGSADGAGAASPPDADEAVPASEDTSDTHDPDRDEELAQMELDADAEVDPVMLAKEFSGLLQVESGDDEASS
jgi:hypothetical protein